ncbi:MAG TPA: CopG family transcriptional regulator [Thermoanaerobaculia bacterium]|jgi:hypothetical protein|nr:CopG family transcriptional regulator [Thermoanaerobaculia bacterium]
MVRMQVQLREEQYEALKDRAAAAGRSISELVRDSVDRWLEGEAAGGALDGLLELAGAFHDPSGADDVAENHDRYLIVCGEDAFAEPSRSMRTSCGKGSRSPN